jgi:hypothetical protein
MIIAVVLLGCVSGPGGSGALSTPNLEVFISEVQPILNARCANATCHGDPARPLEIYGVQNHRLDPGDVYLDGDLSMRELWLNYIGARAFVDELTWSDDDADDCALLTKPLAPAAGGSEHTGGVQFFDKEEIEYQALRDWIATGL